MEARRCVRQSRAAHEAIPESSDGDAHLGPPLTGDASTRRSEHGEQGQEHQEEHGEKAGSKDAERETAGQEGEEVERSATPRGGRSGEPGLEDAG